MLLISILAFSTAIINMYSGVRVYCANRASRTNRLFLLMCVTLSLWGLGYTFMISAESMEAANQWRIFSAIGWCFLYGVFLLFAISFTENRGILSKPAVQGALLVPSLIFFVNTTRYSGAEFVRTNWGWMYPYSHDMSWHLAFLAYYTFFAAWSLWLIYDWGRNSKAIRIRKQSQIIVKTTLAVYVCGAPTDTLLPMFGIEIVPVGILFSTIFISGIWYSISRYKLMTLNFKSAADNILTSMMDPVLLVGEDLKIREVNHRTIALAGKSSGELIGAPVTLLLQDAQSRPIDRATFFTKDYATNAEVIVTNSEGVLVPCLLSTCILYDEFRDILGIILLLHDITDRKKYESLLKQTNEDLEAKVLSRTLELEDSNTSLKEEIINRKAAQSQVWYNANHDPLTDLPNRRLYFERLKTSLAGTDSGGSVLAVLYMDLDNFKYLNDTYGHTHGDIILQQVAARMARSLRHGDTLARVGGDEFLLLIEQLEPDRVRNTIEKILGILRKALQVPFHIEGGERYLTISIGVAIYPEDGKDPETLIKNADIAMYEAKYAGKNSYRFCSSPMKEKVLEKARIRHNLCLALDNGEFSVVFQPQIHIDSGRVAGLEILLRWHMQGTTAVSPDQFIPVAEETGLIVPIGEWVVKTAIGQLKKWHEMGFRGLRIAINVSARQLKEKNFVELTMQHLKKIGVSPEHIEFEITESIAFKRDAEIIAMLSEIKRCGIGIAIDDFGTEYSSFMNVKLIPVDRLKIAMPFVSGIGKNEKDNAIISSIISLSHKIGMKVIAEGVETEAEMAYLRQEKCDEIQGYYFYRPMPAEKIPAILNLAGIMHGDGAVKRAVLRAAD